MGLLKFFTGKTSEEMGKIADSYFQNKEFGQVKIDAFVKSQISCSEAFRGAVCLDAKIARARRKRLKQLAIFPHPARQLISPKGSTSHENRLFTRPSKIEYEKARDLYVEIMNACQGCGARIDPIVKQRYAETSYATGYISTSLLEFFLRLSKEDPENKTYYFKKNQRYLFQAGQRKRSKALFALCRQIFLMM